MTKDKIILFSQLIIYISVTRNKLNYIFICQIESSVQVFNSRISALVLVDFLFPEYYRKLMQIRNGWNIL